MTDMTRTGSASLLSRLVIYQRERFPLAAHGLSVAAFTLAAVTCGHAFSGAAGAPHWAAYAVSGLVLFCQFFLLRVADEFKDARIDARFRPERPVPRGLIGKDELFRLGMAAAAVQLLSVLALDVRLLPLLAAIWLWFALMSAEFFTGEWLSRRPSLYMASHMVILPLMTLFAMAAPAPEWAGAMPAVLLSAGAWIFCGLSFAAGVLLEVGRKIKAPEEERPGVETYTVLWGRRKALALWLLAGLATALAALWLAALKGAWAPVGIPAAGGVLLMTIAAVLHGRRPAPRTSRAIERLSGLWVLSMLISLFLIHV